MIAVVKCCGNNIASIGNALQKLQCSFTLTEDPDVIATADKVILPGVGSAKAAMNKLQSAKLVPVLQTLRQPVLGICLGMQLLYTSSEENDVACLNIIHGQVKRFCLTNEYPVPHMGWNYVSAIEDDSFTTKLKDCYYYFVHSFYAPISRETIASVNYGHSFSAIVKKDNYYGMQFHPEKSGQVGLALLDTFLRLP